MAEPSVALMLQAVEARMTSALALSRAMFAHLGIRGGYVENEFREMLAKNLPRSLAVGTGEVIDFSGARSGQMDALVVNEEQPFQFGLHESGVYIVEGVSAAGEIKSKLTTDRLTEAIEHGARFKALRAFPSGQPGRMFALPTDVRRFYECPPFFVFAFETDIKPETLIDRLVEPDPIRVAGSATTFTPVDAVFVLGRGLALDYGDGHGGLNLRLRKDDDESRRAAGWLWRGSEWVLGEFMLWLHTVMPRPVYPGPVASTYLGQRAVKPTSVTAAEGHGWETLEPWRGSAGRP